MDCELLVWKEHCQGLYTCNCWSCGKHLTYTHWRTQRVIVSGPPSSPCFMCLPCSIPLKRTGVRIAFLPEEEIELPAAVIRGPTTSDRLMSLDEP